MKNQLQNSAVFIPMHSICVLTDLNLKWFLPVFFLYFRLLVAAGANFAEGTYKHFMLPVTFKDTYLELNK
jgi:hypothetical protein